ncbi:HAD family hydrolase [Thomasclavelia cocleata]|jgi:beta-phosphoglucomutase|uniref:HAD family hydrolase n=1 Tax=Thomasclavelia cocleata TaxID=69824 RepID=UPI00241C63C0|nr:HAD family phosphatase [Thomasclavelia cocleata]MCI9131253.1 HAD family phosphatase [Thomasclavelia cocleata]MCI9629848.1 HAD family phosphatase [Thomasclavelia cocleata]
MKKTTIVFDMDGVIFDSETMYINELITFFKIHHIDISINDCKRIIGVDHHKFRSIVYNFWQNKTSKEEFDRILNNYYDSLSRDYQAVINPGIYTLLEYLKNNHYKIALASSSSIQLVNQAISSAYLKHYFDLITSGEIFRQSKPNPEIYLYTINKLQSSKDETLIIEDSLPGIQAAVNARVDVIALKDKNFGIDQSQAQIVVDNLVDIIKYLDKF